MILFELLDLKLRGMKPEECKIHLAVWNGYDNPIDVYLRSEEHTSELQSRGLISYAVFCLKKKKIKNKK